MNESGARPETDNFTFPFSLFFLFLFLFTSPLSSLDSLSLCWLTQLSSLSSSREGRCCFIALSLASPERIAGASSFPSLPLVAAREGRVLPRLCSCFPTQHTYPPTHIIAPINQVFEEPSSYSLADTPLGESWRGNAFGQFISRT